MKSNKINDRIVKLHHLRCCLYGGGHTCNFSIFGSHVNHVKFIISILDILLTFISACERPEIDYNAIIRGVNLLV